MLQNAACRLSFLLAAAAGEKSAGERPHRDSGRGLDRDRSKWRAVDRSTVFNENTVQKPAKGGSQKTAIIRRMSLTNDRPAQRAPNAQNRCRNVFQAQGSCWDEPANRQVETGPKRGPKTRPKRQKRQGYWRPVDAAAPLMAWDFLGRLGFSWPSLWPFLNSISSSLGSFLPSRGPLWRCLHFCHASGRFTWFSWAVSVSAPCLSCCD